MAERSIAIDLVTPAGTLTFNPSSGDGYYLTEIIGLDGADIRNPVDPLPQHDGALVHRFFRSALTVTLRGYIQAEAGITTRRGFEDNLRGYTDRLIRPTNAEFAVGSCRLRFTPSGYSDRRIVDAVQLAAPVQISSDYLKTFEFTIVSPYPYVLDLTQTATSIAAAGSSTLTNAGNATMYPVIQVDGAFSAATVTNTTRSESIVFASAGVAGGHYAEVDCFRKTAYLDGSGVNLLGKIDFAAPSTFLALQPGANVVTFTGAGGRVYWNNAWI